MRIAKLKAAALFARKKHHGIHDDPLTGVRIERDRVVSTNGQAAIIVHDDDGPESAVMIDPAALRYLRNDVTGIDGTRLTGGIVTVDAKSPASLLRWPDLDAAVPAPDTLETPVGVSVDLLEQLLKAAKLLDVRMLRVQIPKDGGRGRLSALRVTPMRDESFVAIIMPCRID